MLLVLVGVIIDGDVESITNVPHYRSGSFAC